MTTERDEPGTRPLGGALGPVDRARRAAAELLLAYQDAASTTEREQVAAVIASLTPHGDLSIAELTEIALREDNAP